MASFWASHSSRVCVAIDGVLEEKANKRGGKCALNRSKFRRRFQVRGISGSGDIGYDHGQSVAFIRNLLGCRADGSWLEAIFTLHSDRRKRGADCFFLHLAE